ncbi:hypothetical protein ACSHWO_35155 (plasmid) [Streptomyces sp. HUAS TT3]|uniref:hypothetical protein n=1 Tax=Streptomyces sp. HUAS TT3 TaxID=3447510 RepID=UPI003F654F7D
MQGDRLRRLGRSFILLSVLLAFLGAGASLSVAVAADEPKHHASVGPPSPIPAEWAQWTVGIDADRHYCLVDQIDDRSKCWLPGPDDPPFPGRTNPCEGADGNGARNCDDKDQREAEARKLKQWREAFSEQDQKKYAELITFVTDCVTKNGRPFTVCKKEGTDKLGEPVQTPLEWAAGKFSQFASNALKEAASYIGKSVVWLLEKFARFFNTSSTINLKDTGLGKFTALMTSLSAVVACFLLLLQFGKVAISHNGAPAATALTGLAKWAVVSSVYLLVAQEALRWSDVVSDWIVNYTFDGGGSGSDAAAKAMELRLGKLFGGLITGGGGAATAGGALITGEGVAASAVGVLIVIGIICILAIAALWVEVLLRQVGIMLIIGTMPITLAGQLSDTTAEWWPKARNAFVSLVLMKPAIVCCFSIGVFAMTEGEGVQNMIVGFVMFLAAALCWPVLAKFMVFTTNGAGSSMASGWISSLGSSATSGAGGGRIEPSGAGSVGGGAGYTKALDAENAAQTASPTPASADGGGGSATKSAARFGGKAFNVASLGLQVLAAGKDTLESGLANTAAHAGLDQGAAGGRHVVIPPRRQPTPAPVGAPPPPDPDPKPDSAPKG